MLTHVYTSEGNNIPLFQMFSEFFVKNYDKKNSIKLTAGRHEEYHPCRKMLHAGDFYITESIVRNSENFEKVNTVVQFQFPDGPALGAPDSISFSEGACINFMGSGLIVIVEKDTNKKILEV